MKVKKNPGADPRRFSFIFFQVGLIIMLGITYTGLEWKFSAKEDVGISEVQIRDFEQAEVPITRLNTPPPPPPPPPIPEVIEIIEDREELEETTIRSTESKLDDKADIVQISDVVFEEEEEEIEKIPFILVEQTPVFPGCENFRKREDQKDCMSKKIDAHVKREFNIRISEELGMTGFNRIFVTFKIDENGDVVDIKSRGPNKRVEEEAVRIIRLLPKMIPGKQRDKPVAVEYSLPIMYEIREKS